MFNYKTTTIIKKVGDVSSSKTTEKSGVVDEAFKAAEDAINKAGEAIDKAFDFGDNISTIQDGDIKVTLQDGKVVIEGDIKSLQLNDKEIKL